MSVIYGHRNRNHLRALEKATLGDTIEVTIADGMTFVFKISDVTIYESMDELKLSAVDGKALVLVTCYPFRYSGSAPGKCVVTAICQD